MRRSNAAGNAVPIPRMPLVGKGKVDAVAFATALLDGDIYGFQPLFPNQPLRLVPIALDQTTIQTQTATPIDDLRYNPGTGAFSNGSDGLPEISVTLTTNPPPSGATATAATLNIGITNQTDFLNQISIGVYPAQLARAPFNGAFLLQPDTVTSNQLKLAVPGSSSFASGDGSAIATQLGMLAQAPYSARIWPIFSGYDGTGQPIITGFIAARLVSVNSTTQAIDDGMGGTTTTMKLTLTLQPTLISEPSAATNTAYHTGYLNVPNQTIAKIRLVP